MWTPLKSARLHVIRQPAVLTASTIAALMREVAEGRAAPDFDILADFSDVTRVDISMSEMVQLATARRAALPETGPAIHTASICPGEAARDYVETWNTFFDEANRAIVTRVFDQLDPALDWLGRQNARGAVVEALSAMKLD